MPTSRSPKPGAKPPATPQGSRFVRPLILVVVLAALTVMVVALPASLVKRFLPPAVRADDFSGSLWHGSAGRLTVNALEVGAIEWRVHPASLLRLMLSADVRWVKVGFVADALVDVDSEGVTARNLQGAGPLEDLQDMGVPSGLRGTAGFKFNELKMAFAAGSVNLLSAVGDVTVSDLLAPQFAGVDLGGYALHLANGAITPDADATAELTDTGGPLEVQATIHFSAQSHTGMLSGTVKERPDAPPALRNQLANLEQLHARDAQGRIPIDLEFTL